MTTTNVAQEPAAQPNRFREAIPNAVPWRERQKSDALVSVLIARGATDAEAADVLAADRERMRGDLARLLAFQPPPPVVLDGGAALAVAAERATIAADLARCFVPGDDCETAENVRKLLAGLRGQR